MINQILVLTKLTVFTWNVSFNKIKHLYKTMIKSNIIYDSTIWHEFKITKLISQKTINSLTIIQNNNLKRICNVYKKIFIAKLKTDIYVSFINIHLNELQVKAKQRLQNLKHCKKTKENNKRIYRMLKKKANTENRNSFRRIRKNVIYNS